MEDGPIVDPFTERIGVEDAAQQGDGLFGGVPILDGKAGRDADSGCVSRSCLSDGRCGFRWLGRCGSRLCG